jgi:hypothetical protein
VLGEGDVLGEMGLLEERPRSATARALEPVVADAVSPAVFARLLVTEPTRSLRLLRVLFERLRTMNRFVAEHAEPNEAVSLPTRVRVVPLTPETAAAVPPGGLDVDRFPFRVGRTPDEAEAALGFNDVELPDRPPYVLSLHHFSLELGRDGVLVRDRGSQRGTAVNGAVIGGQSNRDVAPLHAGDNEVVAGVAARSPFRFRVVV